MYMQIYRHVYLHTHMYMRIYTYMYIMFSSKLSVSNLYQKTMSSDIYINIPLVLQWSVFVFANLMLLK